LLSGQKNVIRPRPTFWWRCSGVPGKKCRASGCSRQKN